ncbi:hypothetical protein MGG_12339 [Pyricularia oryzae 70-15]|uniref:Zn(2)-C6 fungal-type domain-containing protein n=3 Tax=Pyricularia oryzae TaxID=318829 RepID=G4MSQ8_PYRO7|nr:uncharacterized protein MGG_12339 [Pyricularia oryzae 70-15]EHA55479.1 hypothetical protein MGG_12339 [Pyricularia oryzae 70-15]ELQ35432.1 hypothetical protein OOU_Y34scaffold00707g16 [Pyricularia oryzae Y34]KAI7925461.1 hypothetical protein M9X92_003235 [Pyricularia oryzae]
MSEYYHHLLSSMSGAGQISSPQDAPQQATSATSVGGGTGIAGSYQNLGYFTGFPEPIMVNSVPKASRSRRKSAHGVDHVKHRRTRSGCYTCRSRRVKCDETHPICDRCRKGKRECSYPTDSTTTQSSTSATKDASGTSQLNSPASSHDDREDFDDDNDHEFKLDTIIDEEEPNESTPSAQSKSRSSARRASAASKLHRIITSSGGRQGSETPSLEGTKASSPATSTGTASVTPAAYDLPELTGLGSSERPEWAHLPQDVRFYLGYFCEHLTNYHYGILTDAHDFFRTILPALALENEALLYALVGFAAYHCTLRNPRGKMHQFLQYYNKSVTILLGFLKRKEDHSPATLLTILQLATIEEYLGDWINLMGHQRAAYEVLTKLYTPQSIIATPTGRTILSWYNRYDVFVGLMGGFAAALPEDWFTSLVSYYQSMSLQDPANPVWKIEECSARLRLLSREVSLLVGKQSATPDQSYLDQHASISQRLGAWRDGWDPALSDPAYLVQDLGERTAERPDSIVDVLVPGSLYQGPLFPVTLLSCEWHTVVILHECQRADIPTQDDGTEELQARLSEQAFAICRIVESIELWPSSPRGSLILTQACLALAALFLPHDAKHQIWIRRKFALLEALGCIFPLGMRNMMAELFEDASCVRWWLPNNEAFSPVLRAVRAFADERNATAVSAQSESAPDVRHIFSKLHLSGLTRRGPSTTLAETHSPTTSEKRSKGKGKA